MKLEAVLRARRRAGRMMPLINVIPPGLDFSSLKVDLPKTLPRQAARRPSMPPSQTTIPTLPRRGLATEARPTQSLLGSQMLAHQVICPLPNPSATRAVCCRLLQPCNSCSCAVLCLRVRLQDRQPHKAHNPSRARTSGDGG